MTPRYPSATPLRVAVVGAGPFGRAHALELARTSGVELAAIVAPSADRRDALAAEAGATLSVADLAPLLDGAVDAVVISAAAAVQAGIAVTALAADVPVLVEKPVALDAAAREDLRRAAARSSAWLMPGHILRFSAPHAEVREAVRSGAVGRVRSLSFRRHRGLDHQELFPAVHPVLMTMIHDIDLALWLTGERIEHVSSTEIHSAAHPQPLAVSARARTSGGTELSFEISWSLGAGQHLPDALELIGEDGTLALRQDARVIGPAGPADDHLTPAHPFGALAAEQQVFLSSVRSGNAPTAVTLDEALHGLEIAERIIIAGAAT